jgi:hypothetical protein
VPLSCLLCYSVLVLDSEEEDSDACRGSPQSTQKIVVTVPYGSPQPQPSSTSQFVVYKYSVVRCPKGRFSEFALNERRNNTMVLVE